MTTSTLHRTKRAVFLVLLIIALAASGYALYNQFAADSTKKSLADQVVSACNSNPTLAHNQGLNCGQAKDAQDTNAPVVQGPKGDKGDPGAQGPTGNEGRIGLTGPEGKQGAQGIPGATGANGQTGQVGVPGEVGKSGQNGAQGEPGAPGEKGDKGDKGDPGVQGPAGQDGVSPPPASPRVRDIRLDLNTCTLTWTYDDGESKTSTVTGCTPGVIPSLVRATK